MNLEVAVAIGWLYGMHVMLAIDWTDELEAALAKEKRRRGGNGSTGDLMLL